MPALGPRVGGAHVDVNLKFDDRSLAAVGQRIHKQLSAIGDHNRNVYRGIGREAVTAWRGMLGSILAGAPLIGSAVSAASGGLTMLAGSVYSLAQSSSAALPIFTSLGVAGLTLSIGMRNFSAAVSEVDPKKLELLLKGMPKSMQAAVMSTRKLSNEMRAAIWPKLFDGLSSGIDKLRNTGVIQKGLGKMADSLNGLAKGVLDYANSGEGVSTLDKFFNNNAKVFAALSKAVVPFLDGFLRLVNLLTPAALRLSGRITDIGERFQSWTKAKGAGNRIDESMKKAEKTAGLLFKVVGNLFSAIRNVFGAANPATNTFLEMLVAVTQRFEDFTSSAKGKSSIAEWAMNSVDVMRQFGHTIEAVFTVIAKLADSRVIISFLKTIEGAFIYLGKLPLEKIVDGFVTLAEKLQPVSSALLAVIIGGAAVNIFIGSLMGQLGGLFSVFDSFKRAGGGVLNFFKNLATGGKSAGGVGKIAGSFQKLAGILGRVLKFAGLAGLAIWIVTLIAKSKKLQGKVMEVFEAFKGLWEPLKGAFKEISAAIGPLMGSLQPVFDFMDMLMGLAIGVFLDMVKYAFESLGNVIKGAGKIIAGIITVLTGLFTLDFGKMWEGIKKIGSGLWPLLKGLFGLFITFFAPAKLLKIGVGAIKGLGGGLIRAFPAILGFLGRFIGSVLKFFLTLPFKLLRLGGQAIAGLGSAVGRAAPGVLAIVGRLIVSVLKFFVSLPGKLLSFGGRAIMWLGRAVVKYAPRVLSAAGNLVKGVLGWIGRLPGRLILLGRHAITKLSDAVRTHAPKVIEGAGRIFSGVVGWIVKLPGRLFTLGVRAVTKLKNAVSTGIEKLKGVAGDIFNAIKDKIKNLPGDLLQIGKDLMLAIRDGILWGIDKVKKAAGKIGGIIKDVLPGSPVKDGPLTAWNYGSNASGGGRNVIDAITGGLKDTDPIKRAMRDVASAVSTSLTPKVGVLASPPGAERVRPRENETAGAGNVYIGNLMPHDYTEFRRQLTTETRLSSIGGRRAVRV